jgi:lycopene cyclase domain-containing protein
MTVLILSGIIPLLASFWPGLKFYQNIRSLLISITIVAIFFSVWDVFAVYRGHWFFNPTDVWKLRIINLPVEEVLFFVVIPFCCIFTWEAVKHIKERMH